MARLSIDIGVNLQDSTRQLGKLNSALINISKTADDLAKTLKSLGAIKVNPNVSVNQTGGGPSAAATPAAPKLNQVSGVFDDYNNKVIKAATLTEFLEKKLLDLDNEALRLRQTLQTTQNPKIYDQTLEKLKQVEIQTKKTTAALEAQVPNTNKVAGGYTRLTKAQEAQRQATNLATLSFTNIGRVAQDLPFGFLGIANNLTPLIEGFAQLRNISVSTGVSMKSALLASLTGPGGLILAFSAVSAALSFASVGLSYWTRATKKAKDENDKLIESLNKNKESALASGAAMQNWLNVAKNAPDNSEEQKIALDKLNESLSQYGIKLDNASIKNGTAQAAVENLTRALVQQAIANTYVDEAAKKQRTLIDLQKEQGEIIKKYVGAGIIDIDSFLAAADAVNKLNTEVGGIFNNVYEGSAESKKALFGLIDVFQKSAKVDTYTAASILENYNNLTNKISQTKKEVNGLTGEAQNAATAFTYLFNAAGGKTKTEIKDDKLKQRTKDAKTYAEAVAEIRADIVKIQDKPFLTIEEKNVDILNRLKTGVDSLADNFSKQFKLDIATGGDAAGFLSQISKLDFQVISDNIRSVFINAEAEAEAIDLSASLLDVDKLKKQESLFSGILDNYYKKQVELGKKPVPSDGLSEYLKSWFILEGAITKVGDKLSAIGEKLRIQKLSGILKEYRDDVNELNNDKKFRIQFADVFNTSEIEEQIKFTKGKLDEAVNGFRESFEANKGKPSVLTLFFANEIAGLEKELAKLKEKAGIKKAFEDLAENLRNSFADAFVGIFEGLGSLIGGDSIGKVFAGVFASLTESLGRALLQFAKDSAKVKAVIDKIKELLPTTAGWGAIAAAAVLGGLLIAASKLTMKGFADGGFVSGSGSSRSDSIPARLSNGEYVINAKSVRKYGKGFFDSLNNGVGSIDRMNGKFADGGLVDSFRQFSRSGGAAKALVNRFDTDLLNMDFFNRNGGTSKALVNRPMTATPTNSPYIAETRISGQDLRLVLKRADRQYSNIT